MDDPLPIMTPSVVKLDVPVPPLPTPKMPDPMIVAGNCGISVGMRVVADSTRPFVSTRTLE